MRITEEQALKLIEEQKRKRGFTPMPIERDLLIERIKWKDWSAEYLAMAFCSMYRTGVRADIDLLHTCNLDAIGTRLLFQIIFARAVDGWSDQELFEIELEIKEILDIEYIGNQVVFNASIERKE